MEHHRSFYRRNLPHLQPKYGSFFVTFNLTGTIPKKARDERKAEFNELAKLEGAERDKRIIERKRAWFRRLERFLDHPDHHSPTWLAQKEIATLVYDSILFRNEAQYELDCFTIMPNHVHLLFRLSTLLQSENHSDLMTILRSLKSYTSRHANRLLGRNGAFWQSESFDHLLRNRDKWQTTFVYILENPVKAGLVRDWRDWPWTWVRDGLEDVLDAFYGGAR